MKQQWTDEELDKAYRKMCDRRNKESRARLREETESNMGKCYKYRNSYSCPEEEKDYFYLYKKIIGVDGEGWPISIEFQTDKYGKVHFAVDKHDMMLANGNRHGYQEIKPLEFARAYQDALKLVETEIGGRL